MALPRPPDRTIRYKIKTANIPADLSNAFFSRTQVPHTKCFKSGPYIIIGLANDADRDNHTSHQATENLKLLGFELVESPEQKSARTILARRVDEYILKKTNDDLLTEIQEKNDTQIDELFIIPKVHMLKIKLRSKQQAELLKNKGIKLFSQIVPSYNINIEEYLPVTQCYKCYQFSHRTNQCKETEQVCSKCAARGHDYRNCQASTIKCANCNGDHTAVSFKCPIKRAHQKQQNSPQTTPQPTTSYAQATTPYSLTPKNTNTNTEKLLLAEIIIKYSIQTSFGDLKKQAETMNSLLEYNGCPTIKLPPHFHQTNQEHFKQNYPQQNEETHAPTPTLQEPEHTTPNNASPLSPGELAIEEDSACGESQPQKPSPPRSTPTSTTTTANTTNTTKKTETKRHLATVPQPSPPSTRTASRGKKNT